MFCSLLPVIGTRDGGGGRFGLGNPGGRGGHGDPGNSGGRGDQKTLPSIEGGVWIFSGIT